MTRLLFMVLFSFLLSFDLHRTFSKRPVNQFCNLYDLCYLVLLDYFIAFYYSFLSLSAKYIPSAGNGKSKLKEGPPTALNGNFKITSRTRA